MESKITNKIKDIESDLKAEGKHEQLTPDETQQIKDDINQKAMESKEEKHTFEKYPKVKEAVDDIAMKGVTFSTWAVFITELHDAFSDLQSENQSIREEIERKNDELISARSDKETYQSLYEQSLKAHQDKDNDQEKNDLIEIHKSLQAEIERKDKEIHEQSLTLASSVLAYNEACKEIERLTEIKDHWKKEFDEMAQIAVSGAQKILQQSIQIERLKDLSMGMKRFYEGRPGLKEWSKENNINNE